MCMKSVAAHTFLVDKPTNMTAAEAPASAYLRAVPNCTLSFQYTERENVHNRCSRERTLVVGCRYVCCHAAVCYQAGCFAYQANYLPRPPYVVCAEHGMGQASKREKQGHGYLSSQTRVCAGVETVRPCALLANVYTYTCLLKLINTSYRQSSHVVARLVLAAAPNTTLRRSPSRRP